MSKELKSLTETEFKGFVKLIEKVAGVPCVEFVKDPSLPFYEACATIGKYIGEHPDDFKPKLNEGEFIVKRNGKNIKVRKEVVGDHLVTTYPDGWKLYEAVPKDWVKPETKKEGDA